MSDGAAPTRAARRRRLPRHGPAASRASRRPSSTELARVLRRRELPAGEVAVARGRARPRAMLLIVDGRVSVSLRLPGRPRGRGGRAWARGEVLGEIPLLDGGRALGDRARGRAARACSRSAARTSPRSSRGATRRRSPSSGASPASPARACAGSSAASPRRSAAATARPSPRARRRRRARALRAAGQRLRAAARDLPRLRLARPVGLPDRRPLRALPGRAGRWSPRARPRTPAT